MAAAVQVAGACLVRVDVGAGSGLETLGYSRDGVTPQSEPFWIDVPGDQHAGESGPPIEIQWIGEIIRVRLEMTKWDSSVASKIAARVGGVSGAAAGTVPTAGTLMFANTYYMRLLLQPTNFPKNYPIAIPKGVNEFNHGTKYATLVLEFECHRNQSTGVIWNNMTS